MLDKLGHEIIPGSWIIYGHALGRCAGLRIGKVLAVKDGEPDPYRPWDRDNRITVLGFDDDHADYNKVNEGQPYTEWSRPKPLSKKSTLLFPSRVVVLDEAMIPIDYRVAVEVKLKEINGKV